MPLATTGPIDGSIIRLELPSGKLIYATSSNVGGSSSTTEVSHKDNAGGGTYTETTIDKLSWTCGAEALYAGDDEINAEARANFADVFAAWNAKSLIAITWGTGLTGDFQLSGNAYITSWGATAADGEKATFTFELTGSGAITYPEIV